jgi:holo-[acyl-carrier protein] synthase
VFTETERAKAMRRTETIRAATFAKRFAAKEAAAKALGTGFRRGVFFGDLGVVNLPGGQPTLQMTGGAADRLAAITPAGMRAAVVLTMTDEYPYAYAQVIISADPA